MGRKKIVVALATGCVLVSMLSAPMVCHGAEAATASEQASKTANIAETYREQASKLYDAGKFAEAAEFCKKAAQETKNNADDWAHCGTAYEKAEKFLEAAEAFHTAAKIDKKNDIYWVCAGDDYVRANKYKEATKCYEKAVNLKPNNGVWQHRCGMIYWIRANQSNIPSDNLLEKACKHLRRAAELEPNNAGIQKDAGHVIEQVNIRDEELAKSPWRITNWGAIANDYRIAYQCYCRLVDIDPNNAEYIANLSRFVQAHAKYGFQPYAGPTAPTTNSGSTTQAAPPITAGGDWNVVQTLEDGPVQFNPRTAPGNVLTVPVMGDDITHMYVSGIPESGLIIPGGDGYTYESMPDRKIQIDSQKPLYMIYRLELKTKNVTPLGATGTTITKPIYAPKPYYFICAVFDYEEATNTFTIYGPELGDDEVPRDNNGFNLYDVVLPPNYTYVPLYSIRLIDRNTVEVEPFCNYAPPPGRYEYRKYESQWLSWTTAHEEHYPGYAWVLTDVAAAREFFGFTPENGYNDGSSGHDSWTIDDDWIRSSTINRDRLIGRADGYYEIGVDGLFAFLARKGNVGHAPSNVGERIGYYTD